MGNASQTWEWEVKCKQQNPLGWSLGQNPASGSHNLLRIGIDNGKPFWLLQMDGVENRIGDAEKLQIPVITSLKAKGTILDSHPLSVGVSGSYSRDCANSTLREADLVFFIGSKAGGHVTHFWHFPSAGTPVIQLDISPSELGRNYPNTASILGDAKVSLQRMIDVAQPKSPDAAKAWLGCVHEIVAKWRAENEPHRNSDAVPIRPERICKEISEFLPPDGVVVLCFTGDGGFYYHIAELETARRYEINLVVLVNNNSTVSCMMPAKENSMPW